MDYVECPYDETHIIHPLRMPGHLLKCRKNHPNMELVVCPFNAVHEVRKEELRYHMLHCPNRSLLEREISLNVLHGVAQDKKVAPLKGCTDLPSFHSRRPDEDMVDDEWDQEIEHSRFSLFSRPEPEQSVSGQRFSSRRRVEAGAELRQPTTLGQAARLSQLPSEEKSEVATETPQHRLQQAFFHSSLVLGRGRARTTLPSPDSASRPGAAPASCGTSSPINSLMRFPSTFELSAYPTLARGRAMLFQKESSS
ncbi:uncharacterized protein LOC101859274 isoform X2 [Aplysia californica]|nr:uncharacterized protein LOC101859274 isoform X2 [Aplysia californica]